MTPDELRLEDLAVRLDEALDQVLVVRLNLMPLSSPPEPLQALDEMLALDQDGRLEEARKRLSTALLEALGDNRDAYLKIEALLHETQARVADLTWRLAWNAVAKRRR